MNFQVGAYSRGGGLFEGGLIRGGAYSRGGGLFEGGRFFQSLVFSSKVEIKTTKFSQ